MAGNRDARIRERAHNIWERDGRPEGMAEVHWIQACREIEAEEQAADAARTSAPGGRRRKTTSPPPAATQPNKPRRSRKARTSESTLTDAALQMGRMVAETVSDAVTAGVETVSEAVESITQPDKKPRRKAVATEKTDTPAKGRKAAWSPTDIEKAAAPANVEQAPKRKKAAATGAAKENGTSSPVTPAATARRATGKRRSSASVH